MLHCTRNPELAELVCEIAQLPRVANVVTRRRDAIPAILHARRNNLPIYLDDGFGDFKDGNMYTNHHIIGTDGAFRVHNKKKVGSWCVVFTSGVFKGAKLYDTVDKVASIREYKTCSLSHTKLHLSNTDIPMTNNRGELQAILVALYIAQWITKFQPCATFDIITDSKYSQQSILEWGPTWIAKGKKNIPNRDLIIPALKLFYATNNINIKHVHSHVTREKSLTHPDFKDNRDYWDANHCADIGAGDAIRTGPYFDPRLKHLFVKT